jgi:hypothetical protein
MFFLLYFYFLIKIVKMYRNAFYEIIPPMVEDQNITTNAFYEVIPPPTPTPTPNQSFPSFPEVEAYTEEQLREIRMQLSWDRYSDYKEEMEIPNWEYYTKREEEEEEEEDDQTVLYDDEEYAFHKCGEIDGCYDYSELYESETVVPEYDDYFFLPEDVNIGESMEIDNDDDWEEDYHNDSEYRREQGIERMMDRF